MSRDEFEKLFPVPEGILPSGPGYCASWELVQDLGIDAANDVLGAYLEKWAIFQSGMAAGMERAAGIAEPKNKRGCACTCCDCGNIGDAETTAAWDRATEIAAAIRAMKGEVK